MKPTGPHLSPEVAFDENQAATMLEAEEVRIRSLLTRLETGGVVTHTGSDEHLVPVEDRTPDGGAELAERELELGLLQSLEAELAAVDRARGRLEAGRYGLCETCGEPITAERLRTLPAADHCVTHA